MMVEKYISDYVGGLEVEETGHLKMLKDQALSENIPIITHDVGQILRQLIAMNSVKTILELGCATGYSASLMALEDKEIQVTTIEKNQDRANRARENFDKLEISNRINLIEDEATSALGDLKGPYDLAFIDGAKSHYQDYFDLIDGLVRPGGIVVCDNVFFKGIVAMDDPPKKHRTIARGLGGFLKDLVNNKAYLTSVLTVSDGLTISIKR